MSEPIQLGKEPLDVPHMAITITEVARHAPPNEVVWPHSLDYERQTLWTWDFGEPRLMTASAGEWTIPEDEESVPTRESASTYNWFWSTDEIDVTEVQSELPSRINHPIAFLNNVSSEIQYLIVGSGGESATRAVSVNEEEPSPVVTIDEFWVFDSSGELVHEFPVSTSQHELYAGIAYPSLDRINSSHLVFRELVKHPVRLPGGTTRLADTWSMFDLSDFDIHPLNPLVEMTLAAELDGYLDYPPWFFFSDESPDEGEPITYVTQLWDRMLRFRPHHRSDKPDEPPHLLKATSYVPAVQWGDDRIVFFDLETDDTSGVYLVAVRFEGESLLESAPTIIWEGEVPAIFGISTVVSSVPNGHPYIICLDPFTGNLRVFDPLIGAVRFQSNVELAEWRIDDPIASFCHYVYLSTMCSTILIHDPNANEVVELELSAREPGSGSTIVPLMPPDSEDETDE